jgi:transporter family-2 protein
LKLPAIAVHPPKRPLPKQAREGQFQCWEPRSNSVYPIVILVPSRQDTDIAVGKGGGRCSIQSRENRMNSGWIYPFIILGGALQTFGAAMNAQLLQSLGNRWLASAVSFALITAFFFCLLATFPYPLPSVEALANMPWWAPLGGLVGAVQVYAGLTLVHRVGAGPFVGITVTAALIASIILDHYGWFHMPVHAMNSWRVLGAVLMVSGITLIARH